VCEVQVQRLGRAAVGGAGGAGGGRAEAESEDGEDGGKQGTQAHARSLLSVARRVVRGRDTATVKSATVSPRAARRPPTAAARRPRPWRRRCARRASGRRAAP